MSTTLTLAPYPSSKNVYITINDDATGLYRKTDGTFISTGAAEAAWSTVAYATTETVDGVTGYSSYAYDLSGLSPTLPAGTYTFDAFDRDGSTPDYTADTQIEQDSAIAWDGSSISSGNLPTGTSIVSLTYVKEYMGISGTDQDAKLTDLITTVTAAVQNWCDRIFTSASYTEYQNHLGGRILRLKQWPVTAISRLAIRPSVALLVTHSSAQRARASLSSTLLSLTRVVSGVSTTNTITLASYATITLLAAAVTAVGNGWSGAAQGGLDSYPVGDLKTIQGALSAVAGDGGASFRVYSDEMSDYMVDENIGEVSAHFPSGFQEVRIDYTAGYSSYPADLQQGVAMAVSAAFNLSSRDTSLEGERIGDYSYKNRNATALDWSSPIFSEAKCLLGPYRRISAL